MVRRIPGTAPISAPLLWTPDGHLIRVDATGCVSCLDPATGDAGWAHELGSAVAGAPGLAPDGVVYVADADGRLHALDPDDVLWSWDAAAEAAVPSPTGTRTFAAGVVLGEDGHVYAGSDDWHVYSWTPDGRLRWATPTGLPVRAPCALDGAGGVLVPGLDGHLVALSAQTGDVRWRRDLGHPAVAPATVARDGTAVVSTFAGRVSSVDTDSGQIHWRRDLGAPVQGAAALLVDGLVVGTLDGRLVCLDPSGQVRWIRFVGAAVRAGVTVVDDDDGPLVVAATDAGEVWALSSEGAPRWCFDLAGSRPVSQVHAPVTAGPGAIAVATTSGDVWVLPLDGARRDLDGFTRAPESPAPGVQVAVGRGRFGSPPTTVHLRPGEPLRLRLLGGESGAPRVLGTPLRTTSDWPHRVRLTAERRVLHVVPTAGGTGAFPFEAALVSDDGDDPTTASVTVEVCGSTGDELPRRVRIQGLALLDPALATTLHPAGLGLPPVDLTLLEIEGDRAVAWAVQALHSAPDGSPRVLRSAFTARRHEGSWILTSDRARLVLGAHTLLPALPSEVRLALHGDAGAWTDGSVELSWAPQPLKTPPVATALRNPRALLERAGKPFLASRDALRALGRVLPQASDLREWGALAGAAARTLPLGARLLDPHATAAWGLVDGDRRFTALGALHLIWLDDPEPRFEARLTLDRQRRRVRARLTALHPSPTGPAPGLLLVDDDALVPIPLDYVRRTTVGRAEGVPTDVMLELPLDLDAPPRTRVLVVDQGRVIARASLGRP